MKTPYHMVTGDKIEGVSPEWWGHKFGFVSGGFLGAESRRKKSLMAESAQNCNERTVFFEDDQENLYNLVQVCTFSSQLFFAICFILQPTGTKFEGTSVDFLEPTCYRLAFQYCH